MKEEDDSTDETPSLSSYSSLLFTIPGRAIPTARPRVSKRGGVIPNLVVEGWMTVVRAHAAQAADRSSKPWPTARPLRLAVRFFLAQPATRRPDLDNLAKAILDALGGGKAAGRWAPIVYLDDAQVVELSLRKEVAISSGHERVEVEVEVKP